MTQASLSVHISWWGFNQIENSNINASYIDAIANCSKVAIIASVVIGLANSMREVTKAIETIGGVAVKSDIKVVWIDDYLFFTHGNLAILDTFVLVGIVKSYRSRQLNERKA